MTYQRLLLVSLIQTDLLALAQTVCGKNGNYTSNSVYGANINTTLSSIYTNIGINGFYNASAGQGPDRVNAIALCRGDVQLNVCRQCVQEAGADLVESCPIQKEAFVWSEFCSLRYSNGTIYGAVATRPAVSVRNTQNVTSPWQFREAQRALLHDLRGRASAGSSTRKVAAGSATGPDSQMIFGLVQLPEFDIGGL
ncbi:cysteine-rich receptor-like protein kinase 26 [Salvia hispanica]|uniref:cysteine-rich receptor-like protein kinase 26 n=1 Tax=Salvia hispanica TaxID=49212 RepID=UPI0020091CEE|nr:cysteine-rich receptor-like protein kinase 26 [Salvia hispanica]